MHMIACHTWHFHDAQVQQSGVLGAGASEERGETARMVTHCITLTPCDCVPDDLACSNNNIVMVAWTHVWSWRQHAGVFRGSHGHRRPGEDDARTERHGEQRDAMLSRVGAVSHAVTHAQSLLGCISVPHHPAQDKILQSMTGGKDIMVTNDGATILKSLYVDNAAAKVLVGERFAIRRGQCSYAIRRARPHTFGTSTTVPRNACLAC